MDLNLPSMALDLSVKTPTTVCGFVGYYILDSFAMIDGIVLRSASIPRHLLLHFACSASLSVWHRPNNNFI